jgi:hypothetical protein
MVHYNYSVKNWEVPKQKLLYFLFKELLLDRDLMGESPRNGTTEDPNKPYVEIEANERVRIRRVTHLSEETVNSLIQEAEKIYIRVRRMQSSEIPKAHREFWERNGNRKAKIDEELYNVTEELKKALPDDDGKVPFEFELDEKTNRKLNLLTKIENKTTDEVVEKVITKHLDEIKDGKICCFCNKKIIGMGNNPKPVMDEGRCCDVCNINRVIPARINQQSKGLEEQAIDSLNFATETDLNENIENDEVFYEGLGITVNDRLKNYQLVKKYWTARMERVGEDDFIHKENMDLLKAYWKTSFKQSLEDAKLFEIEDEVIPLLLHTECEEEKLPFPSVYIDAKVQIKNRTYFGFHIGSFYTDKTSYRAILSVYSKYVEHKGEMVKVLIPDFILLARDNTDEKLPFRENDLYHSKIRNFIFSFCAFINEPDVVVVERPVNPKNNERRIARGVLPLPSYKKITITGDLKVYVERIKDANSGSGTRSPFKYKFWVRGFYRHFKDKKRYKELYLLNDDELKRAGLTFSQKYEGVLRKWVKPFIKGQGILIKQSWEVK